MEKIKTEAFDTPTKGSRMLPFLNFLVAWVLLVSQFRV